MGTTYGQQKKAAFVAALPNPADLGQVDLGSLTFMKN
jgi:hypothetical protein